jgi:hypothetical protein
VIDFAGALLIAVVGWWENQISEMIKIHASTWL